MKSIRIGLATLALLLTTAFVLAACSGQEPQTTTEAPAPQTQQASPSQQTTSPPAAAAPTTAPTATLPPANTPKPALTATPVPSKPAPTAAPQAAANESIVTPATGNEQTVPEIRGIASWINSDPLTFEEQRGKVVLVDFWTYTCVN